MSYAALQQTIADFLNRTDLSATIPAFIDMAEARLQRDVRHWRGEKRAEIAIAGRFTDLPADYLEMTRLHVTGADAMELVSHDYMQEWRDVTGVPRAYCIVGGQIEVAPFPAFAMQGQIAYHATLPKLRDADTNWLYDAAPDCYIYGALIQSAPYLQEDARIATWSALYESAVAALNRDGVKGKYAGRMVMRTPGTAPRVSQPVVAAAGVDTNYVQIYQQAKA